VMMTPALMERLFASNLCLSIWKPSRFTEPPG